MRPMQSGDIVRWIQPTDHAEAEERYEVLEVQGPAVLCHSTLEVFRESPIPPVFTFRTAELVVEEAP